MTGALYFSGVYLLTDYAGLFYLLSMVIAFVPAYAAEFLLNSIWTYKRTE